MSMKVKHWGLYSVQHATGAHDASYLWDIDFALPALLQVLELLQEDLSEGATDHVLVRLDVDVEQIVTELRVGSHKRVCVASQVRAGFCEADRHRAECRIVTNVYVITYVLSVRYVLVSVETTMNRVMIHRHTDAQIT